MQTKLQQGVSRPGAALSLIVLWVGILAPNALAQLSDGAPYEVRVLRPPGLIFLQLTTNEGKVNVYLPAGVREGEQFSGTMESLGTVSSSATYEYTLTMSGQSTRVKDGAFHWKMPVETEGHIFIRFANAYGEELAATELSVATALMPQEAPRPGGEQFHFPGMIQGKSYAPVFGPFDGDSSTTHAEVDGQQLRILAEMRGKAMVESPRNAVGVKGYVIKKGSLEARGETRVLQIEQTLSPIAQRNGKTGRWRVRVSGLTGITEDVPLKFEIELPQTGLFQPTPPYSYFISAVQHRYIMPNEVKRDGTFSAERVILRIVTGPLDAKATLVVPQDMHELVEMVLRSPRHDWTKMPAVEYAASLKPYGESAMQVLAEFLVGPLPYEALTALFLTEDQGARWVIPYLTRMDGQPLGMAVDAYAAMALKDPEFKYKADLRSALVALVRAGRGVQAAYALGKLGTPDDIPLLEDAFRAAQARQDRFNAEASEAALARFGVKNHIDHLADQVSKPGPFWSQDVQRAVYADRPELIPALCQHVHDPSHWYGDYGDDPGGAARSAIQSIEHKNLTDPEIDAVCKDTGH